MRRSGRTTAMLFRMMFTINDTPGAKLIFNNGSSAEHAMRLFENICDEHGVRHLLTKTGPMKYDFNGKRVVFLSMHNIRAEDYLGDRGKPFMDHEVEDPYLHLKIMEQRWESVKP